MLRCTRRVLALVVALSSAAVARDDLAGTDPPETAPAKSSTASQLIARLTSDESQGLLYDAHGNTFGDLEQLEVLRFSATAEVMRAIDRMKGDSRLASVRSALFDVLGFVKDPASIEWLRQKRRSDVEAFYQDYLPAWKGRLDGFGSWEWLTGREQWIAFWLEAFNEEQSPDRRIELLSVLCQFDDASVVSFFETRRVVAKDAKEVLFIENYLGSHGTPIDSDRVVWAVDMLSRSSKNDDFLVSMARGLRHEAFVPFLIGISHMADPNTTPPYYAAERDLQAITFQCDLHGKAAWQHWYATHGKEGRSAWTRTAVDSFRLGLEQHPKEAARRFEKLVYCWNEISMLPFVEGELAPHDDFHNSIIGWINLTYSDFARERLRPLAERIGADQHIEDSARRLLQERGYLPGLPNKTWAKTIEIANSRL